MIFLTSPAKTLDFDKPFTTSFVTQPLFPAEAEIVAEKLKKCSVKKLEKLMDISSDLAELNVARFAQWTPEHNNTNSRPAIIAYQGDIFEQLTERTYTVDQQIYAQQSLRIISGLYGLVRAYDLIEPYRLEMKIPVKIGRSKNLYNFWGKLLTQYLENEIVGHQEKVIVDLASHEYGKVIRFSQLSVPTVTIEFNQIKKGKQENIGIFAKIARGQMIEYCIKNKFEHVSDLKSFSVNGYTLQEETKDRLLFVKTL